MNSYRLPSCTIALLLGSAVPLAHAAPPQESADRCYYHTPISKAAYDLANATLRRKPDDLAAMICVGEYQRDVLKQYEIAVSTLKRAETASLNNDEAELNLIHRSLHTTLRKLPERGRYADDKNYYETVRNRADDENIAAFDRCFRELNNNNFDAAIAAALPNVRGNTRLTEGNLCLGKAFYTKGDFPRALMHFQRMSWVPGGMDNGLALAQLWLSRVHFEMEQFDLALEYGNLALSEYRRLKDKQNEASLLNNLGMIYKRKGDKRRATIYYEQSLALRETDADKAATWANLGLIYDNEENYPKAIDYLQKALMAERNAGDKLSAALLQLNLGAVHTHAKDYPQAERQLMEGLQTVRQLGATDWEIAALQYLAWLSKDQGEQAAYLDFLQQALTIAEASGNQKKNAILKELNKVKR